MTYEEIFLKSESVFNSIVANSTLANSETILQKLIHVSKLQSGFSNRMRQTCKKFIKHESKQLAELLELSEETLFSATFSENLRSKTICLTGNTVSIVYPYNKKITDTIYSCGDVKFQCDYTSFTVSGTMSDSLLILILKLVKEFSFQVDINLAPLVNQLDDILTNSCKYLPCVTKLESGEYSFKNTHKDFPVIRTTNLLEALFHAKMHGILDWDIPTADIDAVDSTTIKYLKNNERVITVQSLLDLKDIVSYNKVTLVAVSGDATDTAIESIIDLALAANISINQISVCFRSEINQRCNELIKAHNLSHLITDTTKIVIVNKRLPKPLLLSNVQFDTVVKIGDVFANLTLRSYIMNHNSIIKV